MRAAGTADVATTTMAKLPTGSSRRTGIATACTRWGSCEPGGALPSPVATAPLSWRCSSRRSSRATAAPLSWKTSLQVLPPLRCVVENKSKSTTLCDVVCWRMYLADVKVRHGVLSRYSSIRWHILFCILVAKQQHPVASKPPGLCFSFPTGTRLEHEIGGGAEHGTDSGAHHGIGRGAEEDTGGALTTLASILSRASPEKPPRPCVSSSGSLVLDTINGDGGAWCGSVLVDGPC